MSWDIYRIGDNINPEIKLEKGVLTVEELTSKYSWFLKMQVKNAHLSQSPRGGLIFSEGVILGGTWKEGQISNAIIQGGIIQDADIVYAIASGGEIKDSVWREGHAENITVSNGQILFGMFKKCDIKKVDVNRGSFTSCYMDSCSIKNAVLDESKIYDSKIALSLMDGSITHGCTGEFIKEFVNGVWNGGSYKADWKRSYWSKSRFVHGRWISGWWKDGIFDGDVWEDGIWDNGVFVSGEFRDGEFHGGEFHGSFSGGDWVYGTWMPEAKWRGGSWKKGRQHSKNGPIVYDPPSTWEAA